MSSKDGVRARRKRRPKPLRFRGYNSDAAEVLDYAGGAVVAVYYASFRATQSRQLARWLLRAADYLAERSKP